MNLRLKDLRFVWKHALSRRFSFILFLYLIFWKSKSDFVMCYFYKSSLYLTAIIKLTKHCDYLYPQVLGSTCSVLVTSVRKAKSMNYFFSLIYVHFSFLDFRNFFITSIRSGNLARTFPLLSHLTPVCSRRLLWSTSTFSKSPKRVDYFYLQHSWHANSRTFAHKAFWGNFFFFTLKALVTDKSCGRGQAVNKIWKK